MIKLGGTARTSPAQRALTVAIWVIALVLFAWPVLALVAGAFWDNAVGSPANWGLGAFRDLFGSPQFGTSLWHTFILTIVVAPVSLLLGLALAITSQFSNVRLRGLITPVLVISYTIPPMFYAIGYSLVGSGRAGIGNDILSSLISGWRPLNFPTVPGMMFVSILRSASFAYILMLGPVSTLGRSQDEAARIAGARLGRRFFSVLMKSLQPTVIGTAVLLVIVNVELFDTVFILGNPAHFETLTTLSYNLLAAATPDFPGATAVGALLMVLVTILVLVQQAATGRGRFTTLGVRPQARLRLNYGLMSIPVDIVLVLYSLIVLVIPVGAIVVTSFTPFPGVYNPLTLASYQGLFSQPQTMHAIWTTLLLVVLGASAATFLTRWVIRAGSKARSARSRAGLAVVTMAPIVFQGILAAIAFTWAVVLIPPLRGMYGTWVLMFLALMVMVVPQAYVLLSSSDAQFDPTLEYAARVCGASHLRTQLRIIMPLAAPSLVNAWFLGAVVIAGALDVPLVLGSATLQTVSSTVYGFYANQSNFAAASALLIVMLVVFSLAVGVLRIGVLALRADLRPRLRRRRRPAALAETMTPILTGE